MPNVVSRAPTADLRREYRQADLLKRMLREVRDARETENRGAVSNISV